ncbi:MAG TPA: glutamine amidotransferase [Streptosporangiales bacterium]
MSPAAGSRLRLVSVYPELLGTYGDAGNVTVLERRARLRGIECEVVTVRALTPVPDSGDVYVLGGGEDLAQTSATRALSVDGGLRRAVRAGAAVFAVCAGLQMLGEEFPDPSGRAVHGLGLLDVVSTRLPRRAVGEIATATADGLVLSGFENHGSGTQLGPDAAPLGHVLAGIGNGTAEASEGARQDRIVATYLHGPALARNPDLADLVLSSVVGDLPPLPDPLAEALREERLTALLGRRRTRRLRATG